MPNSINTIKKLLPELNPVLFNKPNLVATGIGYKKVQGKKTGDLCIICSVETKVAATSLSKKELIPDFIEGLPTDVNPVGYIYPLQAPTGRFRPSPGGVSIGHLQTTAGTLGCLVKKGESIYILSNNHVLANSNQSVKGDAILQPGPIDGGNVLKDQIAELSDFIPIKFENENGSCKIANAIINIFNFLARLSRSDVRLFSKSISQNTNLVDCAIAKPLNEGDVMNEILQIGTVKESSEGVLDMNLKKSGRTTGLTGGTIEQVDATVRVNFGSNRTAIFTDQLIAGDMSQGGDSGSIVLSDDNEIVGLLFAGNTNFTIINRIQNVFQLLDVTLI